VNGEFSDTSAESPADGKSTLVGSQSTAHAAVVCLELAGGSLADLAGLSTVADGSSDADGVASPHTECEHNAEVVVGISGDGGGSGAVDEVLAPGLDGELPLSVANVDSEVSGGESEGDWVTVGVGWVSCPSVLQEGVHGIQVDVVEVESDGHGDGKRGIQGVIVVVVIVDEGGDVVGVVKNTLKRVGAESSRSVKVMVNVAVQFVTEDCQTTIGPVHSSRSTALLVWVFVGQKDFGGKSRCGTSDVQLGARAGGDVKRSSDRALTVLVPSL